MFRRIAPLVFLSCLLFPATSYAQKTATIAGNVYIENEYTVAKDVTVSLMNDEHQLIETETTADAGQFRFGSLIRAVYYLTVSAPGYETLTVDVDISMTSDRTLTLYLKPLAKKQEPTISKTVSTHELSMSENAREHMEAGMKKLYQAKDAHAASVEFEQALQLAPTYYEAAYQLGVAEMNTGDNARAEEDFRKAIALSGDKYPEADIGLGTLLLDTGKVADAERSLRHGLQLNPNLWLGHYELGRALLKDDRLFEAQTCAEEAKLLAPSAPIVYRLLSNIHLQQKDYPALLEDLNAYLALDPNSPAGARAKEVREQVLAKVSQEHMAPASAKP